MGDCAEYGVHGVQSGQRHRIAFKGLDMSNGVVIDVFDSWYASMFEPLGQLVCMAAVGNG
jgi:hypothetical protein